MRARLAASVLLRNGVKVIAIVLNQKFDDLKGKGVVLSEWKQWENVWMKIKMIYLWMKLILDEIII